MAKQKKTRDKTIELDMTGALNKNHQRVRDELFQDSEFFDPQDLVQVKYEMLRRVEKDKWSVTKASESYGVSRFAYYQTEMNFKAQGLSGLLPKKKGPKRSHKLTEEILVFIDERLAEADVRPEELAEIVEHHFAIAVHPRSIGRAIARWKKKL